MVQTLLVISISILTLVFLAAGVWLMLVFRDLQHLLRQWEQISQRADRSLAAVEGSVAGLPGLIQEVKDSARILSLVRRLARWGEKWLTHEKQEKIKEEAKPLLAATKALPTVKKSSHHFFLKKK